MDKKIPITMQVLRAEEFHKNSVLRSLKVPGMPEKTLLLSKANANKKPHLR